MKRFVILLITMLMTSVVYGQQFATDAAQLQGQWQLEKVETRLYSQQDHRLLEEKTYTIKDLTRRINAIVPLDLRFEGDNYTITERTGIDTGKYIVPADGMLSTRKSAGDPWSTISYELSPQGLLVMHMSASNYKDNARHLAVKLVYTCYYQKKH